jgi:cellulose synthase/poly-beta-1,6-N-acetylglucosamine synthase-like glycosyltransferase
VTGFLTIQAAAAMLFVGGIGAIVLGGRGDRGDGLRHVVLPPPERSNFRVAFYFVLVFGFSLLVALDYRAFSSLFKGVLSMLDREGGVQTLYLGPYLSQTNPLILLLFDGSLAALAIAKRQTWKSLGWSILCWSLSAIGGLVFIAAIETWLARFGVPAGTVFYIIELASLLFGFVALIATIFLTTELPQRYRYRPSFRAWQATILLLIVSLAVLAGGGIVMRALGEGLSRVTPPDGLLVLLALPSLIMVMLVVLLLTRSKERRFESETAEPIDVIMPAYNEEAGIFNALMAIDRAAANYGGQVTVYVADDGSSDSTVELIRAASELAQAANIVCLDGPHGGKAFALNRALEASVSSIVVRIDADIIVDDRVFGPLPHWFANSEIGCVGAFDLPNFALRAWYTRGRLFECLMTFGFARLAYERLDANNIPGTFMAFRRQEALDLGGFVEGMNGEDSDLTFNLGKLGLRSIIDPAIVIYEDVPQTLDAFVEQRTRWSRASFHLAARHMPWSLGEVTPRIFVEARFLFTKLTSMIRPITYVSSAAFFILIPKALGSPLRTLILLGVTLAPQIVLLVATTVYWGFWRELRYIWVWIPFTAARKIGLISGVLSLPPIGYSRVSRGNSSTTYSAITDA